ncbi:MAG: glycosyltransferase family 4 protein [Gammaproteobacteria bacterium]|nr:glycosyltransferase family 4 protein [Gammaproteobacteria bacterium]
MMSRGASLPACRLAFAVSKYFPHGGLQRDLRRIAQCCSGQGHEVHVFTGNWQGERPAGLHIHELDTRALTNHASNDRLARGLHRAVGKRRFDCVVGFTKLPGLDVYYAADPCLASRLQRHRTMLPRLLPRYRALRRQEQSVFARGGSSEILLIAHGEREEFIRHYGTEVRRFHLLPPGIDRDRLLGNRPSREEVRAVREGLGISKDGLMVLAVGSGYRTKGVGRMLHALSALPPTLLARSKLVVIGEGSVRPFERLAATLGVAGRTAFLGPRDDVARFYFSADLLLHPALSENTGTVLMEAMACGLPVLATANCGFVDHLRLARAGLVCPEPFEQVVLNRMLQEALCVPERADWRRNGPEYCRRTDVEGLVAKASAAILARAQRNRVCRD